MNSEILKATLNEILNLDDNEIQNVSVMVKQGDALNKGTISLTVDYYKRVDLPTEGVKD